MKKFAGFFKGSRAAFFSGLLHGTSYVPFPPWAILFCFSPLFLWLNAETRTRKQAFMAGWVMQFTLTLIGFHWIAYTAREFGDFPWPLAILTLLAFAALVHLHIPLAALLSRELNVRAGLTGAKSLFATALVFSLVERVWPALFPFHLGYTLLWAHIPAAQWADLIGFSGLSTLIFLANAWIAWMWTERKNGLTWVRHGGALTVLIGILILGGMVRKAAWDDTDARVNVLAVQANIGNLEKVYAEQGRGYQNSITTRFVNLTAQGLAAHPEVDFALWPETAFPDNANQPERARRNLLIVESGLSVYGKPLLTGGYARDGFVKPGYFEPLSYNSSYVLNARGELMSGPVHKTVLLAFGEYMPFSEQFPILLSWFPFIANFGRGLGPDLLLLPKTDGDTLKVGMQICYEGLFPSFTRLLADKGAQILVNLTNDSWFGTPFEPRQHMIMTLARALEVRRPLMRATNTGITTAILANGEMLQRSPSDQEWTGVFPIAYKKAPETTPYERYGHQDWLLWLVLLLGILVAGRTRGGTRHAASSGLERGS